MTSSPTTSTPTSTADLPDRPRLAVLVASLRDDRIGPVLADWATTRARESFAVDVVDLAAHTLPDDRFLTPGGGASTTMSDTLDGADAFLVITPEYNHSYPAGLKRAIDWHYREWMFKPATVVSYGAQGGLLATEHLRGVLAELHVVTTRRVVGLRAPWQDVDPHGYTPPPGTDDALDGALRELSWWADTLRTARTERPFLP